MKGEYAAKLSETDNEGEWVEGEPRQGSRRNYPTRRIIFPIICAILFLYAILWLRLWLFSYNAIAPDVGEIQKCAIDNLHADLSFLDAAKPITVDEFLGRRDWLARALVKSGIDAFVLEPGFATQYYGNFSQADWEPWEPEERPFLMLILPQTSETGDVAAKTAFLAPHFEEGRVRMLGIPSRCPELDIVVWEEHWNPYETLLRSHLFSDAQFGGERGRKPKLMVDDEIRDFISRGLTHTGFETVGLSPDVQLVRQTKSTAEIEILRAVNTGTVKAVRAMRPCLVPGLTENEVKDILESALSSVGFALFFTLVLFEENAALPHGGYVVGGKKLNEETMVLIDVGAHYLGYSSDITRSFFIDSSPKCVSAAHVLSQWLGLLPSASTAAYRDPALHAEKLKVWETVFLAQTAAAVALEPNHTAASVDLAARGVIEDAGYGDSFTHRLGHGIGIKAHESPYLNKWNTETLLQPGMAFTDEPGVYLLGKFGVRLEDVYLVTEDGGAVLLTGRRARSPFDP